MVVKGIFVNTCNMSPIIDDTAVPLVSTPIPHIYARVFEPYYTSQSFTAFAWTVANVEHGSNYVKVATPSSEDVVLHCGAQMSILSQE